MTAATLPAGKHRSYVNEGGRGEDVMPRVILLGLDGFPARAVSPDFTPNLWALAAEGGRAAEGGLSPLPSSTYPGFGCLLTGVEPIRHHVLTTTQQEGAVPGWAGAEALKFPTLFERCSAAGLETAAVLGDNDLYHVLRAEAAGQSWPPAGKLAPGTKLDGHGYPVNHEVRPHLLAAVGDTRFAFVFGHVNEADTLGHDLGPDHADTMRCYRETDSILGEVAAALAPQWSETLLIVVSDHDMEPRSVNPPIDLGATPDLAELLLDSVLDGGAAWVLCRPGTGPRVAELMGRNAGIGHTRPDGDRVLLVARPGWRFAPVRSASGYHGGAGTTATVAVVGGGHAAVPRIAEQIYSKRPRLIDWAPTILDVLGIPHEGLDGRSLGGDDLTCP